MLLPSRFQPEALPTLGPAIRKPEPVKVDPILSFNKGDHRLIDTSALTPWAYASSVCITEADCRQVNGLAGLIRQQQAITKPNFSLDLGSGEVKVEEPKFRVGDRVRVLEEGSACYLDTVTVSDPARNGHNVWTVMIRTEAGALNFFREADLELIPSPPTSDGWNGGLVVGKVYLTRPEHSEKECFFSRWEGWWMFDSRCAREAVLSDRGSYTQKRTVMREATEAELRGES